MPTKTPPKPPADVNDSESTPAIPPAESELPHVATLEVADNAPSSVLERRVKLTDTAMVIAPETTYDEAIALYDFTHVVRERSRWWLADIVNWMEDHFPDKYTQAIDLTGLTYSRLTTICSVGRKIEPSRRRKEASFTWHERIAYLPYQTADHLLDRAIKEKWTNEQFEDSVARAKGEPTKAEKRAAKEAKPGSTAAKVAASGKQPQLQEGEKPLIWNGYPLRVMILELEGTKVRTLWQGNENLRDDEADKAAHAHGHPHGPALAAWLEEHKFIKQPEGGEPCASTTKSSEPQSAPAAVENTAAIQTALSKSTEASNGAAPNATESAPTSHFPLWNVNEEDGVISPKGDTFDDINNFVHNQDVSFDDLKGALISLAITHQALRNETAIAPAAPPASPEPEIDPTAQIEDLRLRIEAQNETLLLAGQRQAELKMQLDDARDQLKRYDAHTAMETPLQRAEEALLAFAAASESVNWEEIGANKLLRQKWLERLLFPCDASIDRIQATPLKGK